MKFYDKKILVYAATTLDERKRKIAIELITQSLEMDGDGAISVQVMSEFVHDLLSKKQATLAEIDKWISFFYPLLATEVTMDIVRNAIAIMNEYGIQFYDAQIVATAEKLGCHEIVSEDLNEKQLYHGMAVVNPFK